MSIPNDIIGSANVSYLGDPFEQYCGLNGKPLIGGHIEVYLAGTSDKYMTLQDFDGDYNPFKVPLGADGRVVMLADPSLTYDIYVYNSYNDLVCSRLNVECTCPGNISIKGADTWVRNTDGTLDISLRTSANNRRVFDVNTRNKLLDVQSPLYFVENSETATVIGFSGDDFASKEYVDSAVSSKLDTSAFSNVSGDFLTDKFEYDDDNHITAYNHSAFAGGGGSGPNYEAGDHIDITDNVISVTGLPDSADLENAISSAVTNVENKFEYNENNYITAYNNSAFAGTNYSAGDYVSIENDTISVTGLQPSGDYATKTELESATSGKMDVTGMTAYQPSGDYATHDDLTAYQPVGDYYSASNPSGFITNDAITGLQPSGDYVTHDEMTGYQPVGDYYSASNPSGFITEDAITGLQPSGDYATHDDLTGYATTADLTAKQDTLDYGYHDAAISSIDTSALYDASAHARINTLAGRISNLSSDKLDASAFSEVSGDFYTTANPSGFITDEALTSYQTIEGMTAYQPVGDYASATDLENYQPISSMTAYQEAGDYYSASNPSGFISEVPAGTMNESAFSYDASDNITAYNGSAFKAGDEFPQSATEAIETVTANSADWNGTTDTVSSNSGVWGGSALPISAGPGIKFEIVNDTLVASTDETVLWSTADIYKTTAFTLSEPLTAFEKVRFEITGYTNVYAEDTHQTPSANDEEITTCFTYYCKSSDGNPLQMMMGTYTSTDGLNYGLSRSKFLYMSNDGTTWNGNTTDGPHIQKIVGINRIDGGN